MIAHRGRGTLDLMDEPMGRPTDRIIFLLMLVHNRNVKVAKHDSASSCWMIIDSKIYDVTPFLSEHPGGEDILLDASGRDATREFEDVGHSDEARAQLSELFVGNLRRATEEEMRQAAEEAKLRGESSSKPASTTVFKSLAKWFLPLALLVLAYAIRKYSQRQA